MDISLGSSCQETGGGLSGHEYRSKKEGGISPLLPVAPCGQEEEPSSFQPWRDHQAIYTKRLLVVHRDPATSEKGHDGQSGQLGLQPHFPSLPRPQ